MYSLVNIICHPLRKFMQHIEAFLNFRVSQLVSRDSRHLGFFSILRLTPFYFIFINIAREWL